ncbi:hypothetical protein ACFQZ2_10135, partial [Streptomonospora algeriensis]
MAHREHDGSEHAGTRAWDRKHDREAEPGEASADRGQDSSPADQWFGETSPPPPPYAIDDSAVPPPPYAVGGTGRFDGEQQGPQQPQHPGAAAPAEEGAYPGGQRPGEPYTPFEPYNSSVPGASPAPQSGPQQQAPGTPERQWQQQDGGRQQPGAPDQHPFGPGPA